MVLSLVVIVVILAVTRVIIVVVAVAVIVVIVGMIVAVEYFTTSADASMQYFLASAPQLDIAVLIAQNALMIVPAAMFRAA